MRFDFPFFAIHFLYFSALLKNLPSLAKTRNLAESKFQVFFKLGLLKLEQIQQNVAKNIPYLYVVMYGK